MDTNRILGCFFGCSVALIILLVIVFLVVMFGPGLIEGVFSDINAGLAPIQ